MLCDRLSVVATTIQQRRVNQPVKPDVLPSSKPAMKTSPFRAHGQAGFTLVELLTCIVIIAVLAALVVGSFRKLRTSADRSVALSNIRQLQLANVNYSNDHNGRYVPLSSQDENNNRINDWHQSSTFMRYILSDNSIVPNTNYTQIPTSILDPLVVRSKGRLWNRLFASYGYNVVGMPGSGPNSDRAFRASQLTDPARTMAFATATDWIVKYDGRLIWETNSVEGKTTDGRLAFRHGNRAIVVFYDGSSSMISPEDIKRFDAEGGMNHGFWKADFRYAR